ncbi:hypothetical protein EJ08DRAFT_665692 [Tothia fuscella]|uniref:Uncharacterized protein n=1 Tax=Tothia fuscella TaxID=1048955 RepID=A0A9P4NGG0_9PEZI|nr:hypothetical protein EJ08DRAFT_665692 [Tothia fuscella]
MHPFPHASVNITDLLQRSWEHSIASSRTHPRVEKLKVRARHISHHLRAAMRTPLPERTDEEELSLSFASVLHSTQLMADNDEALNTPLPGSDETSTLSFRSAWKSTELHDDSGNATSPSTDSHGNFSFCSGGESSKLAGLSGTDDSSVICGSYDIEGPLYKMVALPPLASPYKLNTALDNLLRSRSASGSPGISFKEDESSSSASSLFSDGPSMSFEADLADYPMALPKKGDRSSQDTKCTSQTEVEDLRSPFENFCKVAKVPEYWFAPFENDAVTPRPMRHSARHELLDAKLAGLVPSKHTPKISPGEQDIGLAQVKLDAAEKWAVENGVAFVNLSSPSGSLDKIEMSLLTVEKSPETGASYAGKNEETPRKDSGVSLVVCSRSARLSTSTEMLDVTVPFIEEESILSVYPPLSPNTVLDRRMECPLPRALSGVPGLRVRRQRDGFCKSYVFFKIVKRCHEDMIVGN